MASIIKKLRRRSFKSGPDSPEHDNSVASEAPSLPHPVPSGAQQPREDWNLNSTSSKSTSHNHNSNTTHPNASASAVNANNNVNPSTQTLPIRQSKTQSPYSNRGQTSDPSLGFAEDVAERNISSYGGQKPQGAFFGKDQNARSRKVSGQDPAGTEEFSSTSIYQSNRDASSKSKNKNEPMSNGDIIQGKYVFPSRDDSGGATPRTPLMDPFPSPLMNEDPLYDRSVAIEVASTEWRPHSSHSAKARGRTTSSSAAKEGSAKQKMEDSAISMPNGSTTNVSEQGRDPKYAVKDAREPPSLKGVIDLTNTETTHTHKTVAKPVYHETVIPTVEHVRHEYVQREEHTHSVHHRIQPIVEKIVLPTKHYAPSGPDGELVEISSQDAPTHDLDRANMVSRQALDMLPDGSKGDWDPAKFPGGQREFAPEDLKDNYKTRVDADGVERSRSTWVHPPNFVGASDTSAVQPTLPAQSHNRKRSADLTGAVIPNPRKSSSESAKSGKSAIRRKELPGERTESIVASTLESVPVPPRGNSSTPFDERVMRDTSNSPSSSKSRERVGGPRHRATSSQSRAGATSSFQDDSIPPVPQPSAHAAKHAMEAKQYPDESSYQKLSHRQSAAQWKDKDQREKEADGVISAARKAAGFA